MWGRWARRQAAKAAPTGCASAQPQSPPARAAEGRSARRDENPQRRGLAVAPQATERPQIFPRFARPDVDETKLRLPQ